MKMTLNEEIELLRCGDWFDKLRDVIPSDEYLDLGWAIGDVLDTLEQLQAENDKLKAQVPRWIPVEERLPKKEEDVLVHYAGGRIDMDWVGKLGAFRWEEVNGEATHWMHLPQPPKEEKKDA